MANNNTSGSLNRGFASMDEDKQRKIARKGGESVPDEKRSFSQDRELAAEAGRKGGEARGSSGSGSRSDDDEQGGNNQGGNNQGGNNQGGRGSSGGGSR